jgi:hypothetical protein
VQIFCGVLLAQPSTIVLCALKQIQDASIYLLYDFHLPQDDGHFASQQKVYNEVGHEMLEHALEG